VFGVEPMPTIVPWKDRQHRYESSMIDAGSSTMGGHAFLDFLMMTGARNKSYLALARSSRLVMMSILVTTR
jgi:hypothetical protein